MRRVASRSAAGLDQGTRDHGLRSGRVSMSQINGSTICCVGLARQPSWGILYLSQRFMNLGGQHVPVCLANGSRTIATFQVAEVSRPLMSVAIFCEMGNRVLFGAAGGVILNLSTGEMTPCTKEEGVYVFDMWVPPLAESPFARP